MASVLEPKSQQSVLSLRHERKHDEVALRGNRKIESKAEVVAGVSRVRKVTVFRQQFLTGCVGAWRLGRSVRIDCRALRLHRGRETKQQSNAQHELFEPEVCAKRYWDTNGHPEDTPPTEYSIGVELRHDGSIHAVAQVEISRDQPFFYRPSCRMVAWPPVRRLIISQNTKSVPLDALHVSNHTHRYC